MKENDKNKESSYLRYCDVSYSYGQAMSQRLPVNNFEWIKDTVQFNEDFIKSYNEEVMKGIFSKLMFNVPKNYINFIKICHFYQKE